MITDVRRKFHVAFTYPGRRRSVLYILVALIAPVIALDLVWLIADVLNALMAIPNLIAVLLLSPVIVSETKKYINNLDATDDTPVPVVQTGKK